MAGDCQGWDCGMTAHERRVDPKLLVMDVDGTLTDGRIFVGVSGEMFKAFDVKDGYAIHNILPTIGMIPAIITGRRSELLEVRCAELGVEELHQSITDKASCLEELLERLGLSLAEVAYIGDDLNDLSCMRIVHEACGVVGCPSDACKEVLEISDFVSNRPGGRGAVREFIDWLASMRASSHAIELIG